MAAAVVALAVCASAQVVLADEPVACGQQIMGRGVLTADLDCSAAPDPNIYVYDGILDLAGFTITANVLCEPLNPGAPPAVHCRVTGPGNFHGCIDAQGLLKLDGATFTYEAGLCGPTGTISAHAVNAAEVTISNYPEAITATGGRLKIFRSMISGVGTTEAISASGNGAIQLVDTQVTSSGSVLASGTTPVIKMKRTDITASTSQGVVSSGGSVTAVDSSVTGSASDGIVAADIRLRRSDASGNCTTDTESCGDIHTGTSPRVVDSTCGTSICTGEPGGSCGVCAND